jgi:hypothetical protein
MLTAHPIIRGMNRIPPESIKKTPRNQSKNNELLLKGISIAVIGLVVLLLPRFMGPGEMRDMIAQSHWVGWFALLLGGVLTTQALARRLK